MVQRYLCPRCGQTWSVIPEGMMPYRSLEVGRFEELADERFGLAGGGARPPPTTEKEATAAQDELIAAGWLREDGNHGIYITEDPAYAIGIDDAGYGMTYHFGDGWVSVSETKQNLQLINAPRA